MMPMLFIFAVFFEKFFAIFSRFNRKCVCGELVKRNLHRINQIQKREKKDENIHDSDETNRE